MDMVAGIKVAFAISAAFWIASALFAHRIYRLPRDAGPEIFLAGHNK
jgi:hypothetical protein